MTFSGNINILLIAQNFSQTIIIIVFQVCVTILLTYKSNLNIVENNVLLLYPVANNRVINQHAKCMKSVWHSLSANHFPFTCKLFVVYYMTIADMIANMNIV